MSNYTKTTDFAIKDTLTSGDAGKIIRGSEFETEFDNISTAIATKADTASPAFTGTVTIPTAVVTTFSLGGTTVTSTADELNYVDGVTSNVQTQLNGKASLASPTFTGTVSIGDLDIYEDGSNSVIKEDGTGSLLIRGTSLSLQASDNANYVQCLDEGAVTLYHNAAPKLATTGIGVSVSGRLSANNLRVTIGSDISLSSSGFVGDLHFSSNYIYVCVATNTWKRAALSS